MRLLAKFAAVALVAAAGFTGTALTAGSASATEYGYGGGYAVRTAPSYGSYAPTHSYRTVRVYTQTCTTQRYQVHTAYGYQWRSRQVCH